MACNMSALLTKYKCKKEGEADAKNREQKRFATCYNVGVGVTLTRDRPYFGGTTMRSLALRLMLWVPTSKALQERLNGT